MPTPNSIGPGPRRLATRRTPPLALLAAVLAFAAAVAGLLITVPPTSAAQATPEALTIVGGQVDRSAERLVTVVDAAGPESAEARDAASTFADEMRVHRASLLQLEWTRSDLSARDVFTNAYAAIAGDADEVAAGRMTFEQFESRSAARADFAAGQLDQISVGRSSSDTRSLISGLPAPLSYWWFWVLIFFTPVLVIPVWIVVGIGAAGAWIIDRIRER